MNSSYEQWCLLLTERLFFLAPLSGKHVLKMVQFYNVV